MVPAQRPSEDEPDFAELRRMREALPKPPAHIYKTEEGQIFLAKLFEAVRATSTRTVATALDWSVQGVWYALNRHTERVPEQWPTKDDLRDLHAAWRPVTKAARGSIRRGSPQYRAVHEALMALIERGFLFKNITLSSKISADRLRRFLHPPVGSPEAIARAIEDAVPQQRGTRRSRTSRQDRD